MKAVRFYAKEDVRLDEVAAPDALGDSQVLVRPLTCGICGTDLHEFAGGPIVTPITPHKFTGATLPQILGHEFSAEVVETGRSRDARAQGRPHLDSAARHAARRLLQPPRPQPSEPEHGLHRPELGLGRHGRTRRHQRLQRQPDSRQRHRRAGRHGRADRRRALRRRSRQGHRRQHGADHRRRPHRRAGRPDLQRRRRLEDLRQRAQRQPPPPHRKPRRRRRPCSTRAPSMSSSTSARTPRKASASMPPSNAPASKLALNTCVEAVRNHGTVVQTGLHVKKALVDPALWALKDITIEATWCYEVTMWPRVIRMISSGKLPVEKIITGRIAARGDRRKGLPLAAESGGPGNEGHGQHALMTVGQDGARPSWPNRSALVVGATGIAGRGVSRNSRRPAPRVYGLSRKPEGLAPGVDPCRGRSDRRRQRRQGARRA